MAEDKPEQLLFGPQPKLRKLGDGRLRRLTPQPLKGPSRNQGSEAVRIHLSNTTDSPTK